MKNPIVLCGWLLMATPLAALAEQLCAANIPSATPSSDFIINMDGTAVHVPTGLMWARCSLGQTWNGTSCVESGQTAQTYFVWQASLQQAAGWRFAGYQDWRLPSIKELASIVETRCKQPAINLEVFPNTPASEVYWTSTPSSFPDNQAWFISFYGGSDNAYVKTNLNRVRPVRSLTADN